ncbi:MAG: hydantoinase/oxoprolinase family protein, partial [Paracoccaceae bacterium]
GAAIDAVLAQGGIDPAKIALASLSTTLATNALVEGQGGRIALVFIGFEEADLGRGGLPEALRGDPVILLAGGHDHAGGEVAPLDLTALADRGRELSTTVTAFAVAARFATRNPAHELAARDALVAATGLPVTCSHDLSAGLNGPKRALTAVLNARLVGMIAVLIDAYERHLAVRGISAPLMVVRGDGALISAAQARLRPIETILSGPAASVAGAAWLTGESFALVSDIGGTTTDICLLRDGKPEIDPLGAEVGGMRTMVEAVAMRTTGLGGDSVVHPASGPDGVHLGPRRLMPVSLAAQSWPTLVHDTLDAALAQEAVAEDATRFAVPLWHEMPVGLSARESMVAARLAVGPLPIAKVLHSRIEQASLDALVSRGLVLLAGVTPSDAAHVLGKSTAWDGLAAEKALTLFARRRDSIGRPLAASAQEMARRIIDRLTAQTVDCLLQAAFAEDAESFPGHDPATLARHPLTRAGLDAHRGIVETRLRLAVPVIGLGASAPTYYGAVGERLGARMILPEHAGVANAIGAVVGQVSMRASGTVTSPAAGLFIAHLPHGPVRFPDRALAFAALRDALTDEATQRALDAGIDEPNVTQEEELREAMIEGQPMFIEARLTVTARGRPRIAKSEPESQG